MNIQKIVPIQLPRDATHALMCCVCKKFFYIKDLYVDMDMFMFSDEYYCEKDKPRG